MTGRDPFCPQVHDHVRTALAGEWIDGGCVDGGPPAANACLYFEQAYVVLRGCTEWLTCPDITEAGPCFMCRSWGDSPFGD